MIEFKDIEVKFGDFVALRNINFSVDEGSFFTLLGPSGCGKTTTLRTLVGFIKPSKGTIYVNDVDITDKPIEKRNIAMVFQSYALFPTLNVYENIAFGLKVRKEQKEEIRKRVDQIAEKVELSNYQLTRKVSELSGGQQQRVAIARALILEPSILCLDEPLSNLDAKLRKQLRNQLKELQRRVGITTIYVTHDQEEALTLSDKVAVFNDEGFIEQVGTPQEVYNYSKTEYVCNFIGEINKLNDELIQNINKQTGVNLPLNKKSYIRTERISIMNGKNDDHQAVFEARIIDIEFYGLYIKFVLDVNNELLNCTHMMTGQARFSVGDKVKIIINPDDIMQY